MTDDDPEQEHIIAHVIVQQPEPIQPRWIRVIQIVLCVALVTLAVTTAFAIIGSWPWVEVLSRVTNVVMLIVLAVAVVLFLRVGFVIKRDRQETAKLETRVYKAYLDLKVENDRAGRPPLPPPPGL
jgi:L-asparagine transporter-like permease